MVWKDLNSGQGEVNVVDRNSTSHFSNIRLELQKETCVRACTCAVLRALPTSLFFLLLLQLSSRTWPERWVCLYAPSSCFQHIFHNVFLTWKLGKFWLATKRYPPPSPVPPPRECRSTAGSQLRTDCLRSSPLLQFRVKSGNGLPRADSPL